MGIRNRRYRNQSSLHEWLSKQTRNFVSGMATARGFVWRQEHTLHNGMRPDAVAFCGLQLRYEQMFGIDSGRRGNTDMFDLMIVFEAKASYSDFLATFTGKGGFKHEPYANLHFLVVPKGFTTAYDLSNLPDHWGILEPRVSALEVKRYPNYIPIERIFFLEAAYTILFKWQRTMVEIKNDIRHD